MANDLPSPVRTVTPGTIIDQDVEALLNLQLLSRGVDVNVTPDIKSRFKSEFLPESGSFRWYLDGKLVLSFQREMVSESVMGYSIKIERLVVPVSHLKIVHERRVNG